ncbi:MAG: hypothetical protein JNM76_17100 [Betaproteobacteria bacterium]|nr:hypothetical protein [Betaproteobacteria bacterium]
MELATQIKFLLIAKAIVEVAGVALIGQGMVALLAGANRDKNIVYGIFRVITLPAVRLARVLTPRRYVRDTHLPLVAFFICFWLWVALVLGVAYVCGSAGLNVSQCTGKTG